MHRHPSVHPSVQLSQNFCKLQYTFVCKKKPTMPKSKKPKAESSPKPTKPDLKDAVTLASVVATEDEGEDGGEGLDHDYHEGAKDEEYPPIDEAVVEQWKSVFELEKNRYSFFDELFHKGYVVDSLEVLKEGQEPVEGQGDGTDMFVEATPDDYKKKQDFGRVVFKTKNVYSGNFSDWYFHGPGRYVWVDGTVYEGEFHKGLLHGKGTIVWPDGATYEGEFIDGERAPGWNVYSTPDGATYAGDWERGLPQGKGKIWYDPASDDSDYYDGSWERGLQHGFGIRQYKNGDRYVGNWEKGERSGEGTMIWLNERQVYTGSWAKGLPHGKGKHIWYIERSKKSMYGGRHVYLGEWENGKREGIGRMIYPCGSTYEGRWLDGEKQGKGFFVNPQGGVVTGLFSEGNLIGGSEVPLHAPTYDCDFIGLLEYLDTKHKFNLILDQQEALDLSDVVSRYLEPLRKLYKRAGELGDRWGNHGIYPFWLKENSAPQRVSRHFDTIPTHLLPKHAKPLSPDGVYPVTRLGLWLLLKDIPRMTWDATVAHFDEHFWRTPSISFQTLHNPFEPVQLWQFLQCLVLVAVSLYVEIPELQREAYKRRLKACMEKGRAGAPRPADGHGPEEINSQDEMDNVLSSSSLAGVKDRERRNSTRPSKVSVSMEEEGKAKAKGRGSKAKRGSDRKILAQLDEEEDAIAALSEGENPIDAPPNSEAHSLQDENEAEERKSHARGRSRSRHSIAPLGENEDDLNTRSTTDLKGKRRKSLRKTDQGDGRRSILRKVSSRPSIRDKGATISEHELSTQTASGEGTIAEDSFSVTITSEHKEKPPPLSVSFIFEQLLLDKLLPCLRQRPGKFLPEMPDPIPPLGDMFDAFQKINGLKEVMTAEEFMKSILPHIALPTIVEEPPPPPPKPSPEQTVASASTPAPKDAEAALESIAGEDGPEMEMEGEEEEETDLDAPSTATIEESTKTDEVLDEEDFLGGGGQAMMAPTEAQSQSSNPSLEFVGDSLPFAEEDLPPEPFLWKEAPKCVPIKSSDEENEESRQTVTKNLDVNDVVAILRTLYPRLVGEDSTANLKFDMVFCDWLWAVSLAARISTDRELVEVLKPPPESMADPTAEVSPEKEPAADESLGGGGNLSVSQSAPIPLPDNPPPPPEKPKSKRKNKDRDRAEHKPNTV